MWDKQRNINEFLWTGVFRVCLFWSILAIVIRIHWASKDNLDSYGPIESVLGPLFHSELRFLKPSKRINNNIDLLRINSCLNIFLFNLYTNGRTVRHFLLTPLWVQSLRNDCLLHISHYIYDFLYNLRLLWSHPWHQNCKTSQQILSFEFWIPFYFIGNAFLLSSVHLFDFNWDLIYDIIRYFYGISILS